MTTLRGLWMAGVLATALMGVNVLADTTPPRTVSVGGEGEVTAPPDLARVTLGIESRKPTMAEARAEVTTTVEKVLALTRSLKIDPKLVNSTRLQVQPEYNWDDKDRKRVLLGYMVSRQVEVEVRDLDQLGPLLERAVDAGVNQVGDPQLDSSRRKALGREAMAKAVQEARLNAETLAAAAGAKLGAIRTLNGEASNPPMPMYRRDVAMAAAAPPAESSYQAGDMKFNATVRAEYDLIVGP